jgi:putative hydrolase of the HAD superfamily
VNGSIKAVLFDLDDTLYDESTFVASGFRTVAAHLADRFGVDKQEAFSAMMAVLTTEGRGKVFDQVLERYGLYSSQLVAELVNMYRSHLPEISLYPDVRPTFQALREYGARLGIITDGLHVVQKRKVAALGLQDLVDIMVYTDELGQEYWKPRSAAFQRAVVMLGVQPGEAVYVGNDPAKDFAGPNSIGMFTIHLCRNGIPEESDCEANAHISTLTEIMQVITGREEG